MIQDNIKTEKILKKTTKVIIGFGSGGTQDESKSEPQVNQPKEIIIDSCHSDHDSCLSD